MILEPVIGNSGFIAPNPEFLNAIRKITKENGALLIFDEVMTGFCLSYGGAQEYFCITPDLTTLGKIIGGGLPVGAYGGRREIMEMVAPAGPMYQAGTLSGNPLAMTAGIDTLKQLQEPGSYTYLDKITGELVQGIVDTGKKAGHAMCGGYIHRMFGFSFTEGPVYNFGDAKKILLSLQDSLGVCWRKEYILLLHNSRLDLQAWQILLKISRKQLQLLRRFYSRFSVAIPVSIVYDLPSHFFPSSIITVLKED
ncbi:hypothetical protein SO802_029096 [Lithocarpus litseifolius]|uniref:Glutamate-1-semialdehyde 2,1-aminomutase n=1 Tax=Lithocarpus litseifolius TaxID=425828 RepID=A0AAW2BSP3_9ROSI